MTAQVQQPHGPRRAARWRLALWSGAAGLLLLPWLAMQVTEEVNWSGFDFAVFGLMLLVAGGAFELAMRRARKRSHRIAAGIAIAAAFFLVWLEAAVGIFTPG